MEFHYGDLLTVGFSPDGSEVAYRRYGIDLNRGTNVVVDDGRLKLFYYENLLSVIESVNIQTMERRILAPSAITGCWSPDGVSFAYITKDLEDHRELWILDLNDWTRREIPVKQPSEVHYSADSKSLFVSSDDGNGSRKIVRIDHEAGRSEVTVLSGNIELSDVSPDGNWLLFAEKYSMISHGEPPSHPRTILRLYNTLSDIIYDLEIDSRESIERGKFSPDGSMLCLNLSDGDSRNIFFHEFVPPAVDSEMNGIAEPLMFSLGGNFPNPFNMSTTIEYTVASEGEASLVVYNSLGQKVRALVSENMPTGVYSTVWDGLDDNGNTVSTGVYIAKLRSGARTAAMKMTLVK